MKTEEALLNGESIVLSDTCMNLEHVILDGYDDSYGQLAIELFPRSNPMITSVITIQGVSINNLKELGLKLIQLSVRVEESLKVQDQKIQ